MRKRRTSSSTATAGSTSRSSSAMSWRCRPELVGERLRVVEVAGGQVLVGHLRGQRADRALDQAAPGELVDADGDVQRDGVLGARGVRRAGRQVHHVAGLEEDGSSSRHCARRAVCTSHCLAPAVCSTNTSWVSWCTAKPCAPDGRQVGVGLAGVAELELELGDQPGQRRPVAVQTLEDDGRAVLEEGERLARVDQPGERSAGERRGPGVARLGQHRRRRGPAGPTACGSRSRSAGGRRPRGRGTPRARPARRGGGGPATPRPSRRRSGRHR